MNYIYNIDIEKIINILDGIRLRSNDIWKRAHKLRFC